MPHPSTHTDDHTAQDERFPAALDPRGVQLDGRSLAALIARAPDLARLFRFYDLTNVPVGDWSPFFCNDVSVLLAEIATVNTNKNHHLFLRLSRALRAQIDGDSGPRPENADEIPEVHDLVVALISKIQNWQDRAQKLAKNSPTARRDSSTGGRRYISTARRLEEVLQTVEKEILLPLGMALGILSESRSQDEAKSKQGKLQNLTLAPYQNQIKQHKRRETQSLHEHKESEDLLLYLAQLNTALDDLARLAEEYLEDSLQREANHDPHVALWLVFAQLFQHNQAHLNRLPSRHLRYYYEGILKLMPRRPSPDRVHVSLKLASEVPSHTLAAGTHLFAGRDAEGLDILYRTENALTLTQASVGILKTLYLPRADDGQALRAWKTEQAAAETLPEAPHHAEGWLPFGQAGTDYAEMGFVLASPALLLGEGRRHVTVRFTYAAPPADADPVAAYLARLEQAYEPYTHAFTQGQTLTLPSDALSLALSGSAGWMPVEDVSMTIDRAACQLVLAFTLAAEAPAITANDPKALGETFETRWPLLKVIVNPRARVYAYSLLDELAFEEVRFDVAVSGLRSLVLENENGPLDASKPFQLFGATPMQGSYLLFGHPELEDKTPDRLTLTLRWFNLPDDFATYYAAYNDYLGEKTFDNAGFEGRFEAWHEGAWHPVAAGSDSCYRLFQATPENDGALAPASVFSLAPAKAPDQVTEPTGAELIPPRPALRYRCALAAPVYGFGQELYARVVSHVATENALRLERPALIDLRSKKEKKKEVKDYPNLPFVPMVQAVSLDYEASHTLRLTADAAAPNPADDQFFLLYPFGQLPLEAGRLRLVPAYPDEGHLYLGLDALTPPQTLSFFFQCSPRQADCVRVTNKEEETSFPLIRWEVLANDRWQPLPETSILLDTTERLTRSGIVLLSLPDSFSEHPRRLPAGWSWLRATVLAGAEAASPLQAVLTQAVRAVRVRNGTAAPPHGALPPLSITALAEKDPAIAAVVQPFPSWGYVPAEKQRSYLARVSERLRHKQRAVHRWDYERLVLEAFPSIGLVKCITHNGTVDDYSASVPPGEVLLVVVPRQSEATPYSEPRVDAVLLREIARYVQAHASYFVRAITVRNPLYEHLRIRASVEFEADAERSATLTRLQEDLARYLVPWWFDVNEHVTLGRTSLPTDEVLDFIERRPYVALANAFSIEHIYLRDTGRVPTTRRYALKDSAYAARGSRRVARGVTLRATTPWSVLVPLGEHDLIVLDAPPKDPDRLRPSTLGRQIVGTDFVVIHTEDDVDPTPPPVPATA